MQPPYSVKPYLSKEEQHCESALLKERWSLIQSGTSRESIKIRLKDGVIMVDKLYGKWDSTTNTLIKKQAISTPRSDSLVLTSPSKSPDSVAASCQLQLYRGASRVDL